MAGARLEFFLRSIGYPDQAPEGSVSFMLRVDGKEMAVEESAGRIVLSYVLTEDDSLLPMLASYASGRMLREDATLAHGSRAAFLWQDAPADADARTLVRLFETFADSCDWWRARLDERGGGAVEISETVIRP